ncbi:MAG: DUF2721 domain-containing protein [Chryseotalea sp.]
MQHSDWAAYTFGASLLCLLFSLALSLSEIFISTKALEIELRDMQAGK